MSRPFRNVVALFHDVEQDLDNPADRETCRRVLRDLLALERSAGACSTCHVAGQLLATQPELARWIREAGSEVAFHSFHHQSDWNPGLYAAEVIRCRQFSGEPLGYRSPRNEWNGDTLDAEQRCGFAWSAEGDSHDEPYFIREDLIRLPLGGDDWQLHRGRTSVEAWVRGFERLLERRSFAAYGCHDFAVAADPEKMMKAWSAILRLATERGRVVLTLTESAELFRRSALIRRGGPPPLDGPGDHRAPGWLARLGAAPDAWIALAGGDPFRAGETSGIRTVAWDPFFGGFRGGRSRGSPRHPAQVAAAETRDGDWRIGGDRSRPVALLSRGIAEYLLRPAALIEQFARQFGAGIPIALSLPGPAATAPAGSDLAGRLFRRFTRGEAERLGAALDRAGLAGDGTEGGRRWLLTGRTIGQCGAVRPIPAVDRAPFHHIAPGERKLARLVMRAVRVLRSRVSAYGISVNR